MTKVAEEVSVELQLMSCVLVAHDMNLSIFKPHWFTSNKILNQDEFSGDILFAPGIIQIPTKEYGLSVFPNRVQMRFETECEHARDYLLRIIGGIAKTLPHTPYTALGFNYEYRLIPSSDFSSWNREVFGGSHFCASAPNNDKEARFGTYFSFDEQGMRLRVDAKPGKEPVDEKNGEYQQVVVNFHRDFRQPFAIEELMDLLELWDDFYARSRSVLERLHGNA